MADLLADGLAFLTVQLRAHASQTVTYTRGILSFSAQATLGRQLLKLADDVGNLRMEWTDLDFLIPADDFIVGGIHSMPLRGDQITLTLAGNLETFEVLPFGADPPWRWADPMQTMFRIHTKHFKTEVIGP